MLQGALQGLTYTALTTEREESNGELLLCHLRYSINSST